MLGAQDSDPGNQGWHRGEDTSNGIQQNWVQILLYYVIAVSQDRRLIPLWAWISLSVK